MLYLECVTIVFAVVQRLVIDTVEMPCHLPYVHFIAFTLCYTCKTIYQKLDIRNPSRWIVKKLHVQ